MQISVAPQDAVAHFYPAVSVFFADVVSFTTMSQRITPEGLVDLLNKMFHVFDSL